MRVVFCLLSVLFLFPKAFANDLSALNDKYLALLNTQEIDPEIKIEFKFKGLHLGDAGQNVTNLRQKLNQLGYDVPVQGAFDTVLEKAVKDYQRKLGIEPDGKAGPLTIRNITLSLEKKRNILEKQLKEMRDVFEGQPLQKFIVVNIPAYKLYAYEGDRMVLESRIIVGRPERPTTLLNTQIASVIVNPTWTPPGTILEKDLFPKGKIDFEFFKEHNLVSYDQDSNPIELSEDITLSEARHRKIRFTQPAGRQNPLGRLKFQLLNSNDIYMHDTNSHGLFKADKRSFSSGCIRVEKYLELASWVLDQPKEKIIKAIETNQTTHLPVKKVPVKTVYWLAENMNEEVLFHLDIYNYFK
jgi:murein L,D-transpeptidase YcbB/YkuD